MSRRINKTETLGCIQIAADYWQEKGIEFFRRWAAPLIASCPGGVSNEELESAITAGRCAPLVIRAVPEISDAERARVARVKAESAQAERDRARSRSETRTTTVSYAGGSHIDISDR
jgi:hypothetical protein